MKGFSIEGFPRFQASSFFGRDGTEVSYPHLLEQVLYPNRESIKEVLRNAKPDSLTLLFSEYFDHCEKVCSLCLLLCQMIHCARALYGVVEVLLEVYCDDPHSLQGDWAFDNFLKFDSFDNPFSCSGSQELDNLRCWFFQLKQRLKGRHRKLQYEVPLVAVATASCLPMCSLHRITKRGRSGSCQLDAAARGAYVIYNDLDTLDRLVARMASGIKSDKRLVRLGLEMGRDMQLIHEVVKQLKGSHSNFMNQLRDLEEHICVCLNAVNKGRSLLFYELSH